MILDALHTTINPILTAFPLVGDITAIVPFCVFKAEPDPIKTKDGIIGYLQKVSVAIIDSDLDRLETNTNAIRNVILAMTGTINDCEINAVQFDGESGSSYDPDSDTSQNSLEFTIDTNTR